ncbi:hypothetical protein Hanom_Chr00s000350g01638311 [Helianthus anomalus]
MKTNLGKSTRKSSTGNTGTNNDNVSLRELQSIVTNTFPTNLRRFTTRFRIRYQNVEQKEAC